jgi:hypothetical protein
MHNARPNSCVLIHFLAGTATPFFHPPMNPGLFKSLQRRRLRCVSPIPPAQGNVPPPLRVRTNKNSTLAPHPVTNRRHLFHLRRSQGQRRRLA